MLENKYIFKCIEQVLQHRWVILFLFRAKTALIFTPLQAMNSNCDSGILWKKIFVITKLLLQKNMILNQIMYSYIFYDFDSVHSYYKSTRWPNQSKHLDCWIWQKSLAVQLKKKLYLELYATKNYVLWRPGKLNKNYITFLFTNIAISAK